MTSPRALIVDDSRTAQVRLKKLLRRYDVEVDTATSAEQALSYLTYQVPVVVFMDHMMGGMDGFEALRVIKSNPETAMIPVVMYTSKSGDLYLGQARALGAVGVLSKDQIKSSSLEPVLAGLNVRTLTDEEMKLRAKPTEPVAAAAANSYQPKPLPPSVDAAESIRKQVAKSLEMNISSVRQEIADSGRVLSSRIVRELKELRGQFKTLADKTGAMAKTPAPVIEPITPVPSKATPWLVVLMLLAVSLSVFSVSMLLEAKSDQRLLEKNFGELREFIGSEYQSRMADASLDRSAGAAIDVEQLFEALAWSFNQAGEVPFGLAALEGEQLDLFVGLIHHLNDSGFKGEVVVELRRGDFCVNFDDLGALVLSEPEQAKAKCGLLSDYTAEGEAVDWLAPGFTAFQNGSPIFTNESIRLTLRNLAFSDPYYSYPEASVDMLAADWNSVAAVNNRVDIRLIAD